ncbi:MAG: flagellar export protein FliJ [Treponema sp.]
MKKFSFELQDILEFRKFERRQAEIELGKALAAERGIQQKLDDLAARQAKIASETRGSFDFQDITSAYRFSDFARAQTEYLLSEMAKAQGVSDEKREVLRLAMQKTDALERLKEEQKEEHRSAEILETDNIIDDIVTARGRRGTSGN